MDRTNKEAGPGTPQAGIAQRRSAGSEGLRGPLRSNRGAQNLLNLVLELGRFFILGKAHANALGPVATSPRRGHPANLASNRIGKRTPMPWVRLPPAPAGVTQPTLPAIG